MKKALSLILILTMALGVCLAFSSCTSSSIEPEYGDKYSYENYIEYQDSYTEWSESEGEYVEVFYNVVEDTKISITLEDDNTGKYEYYKEVTSDDNSSLAEESYVISGTITFEWVETSNNGIHIFEVKTTYDKKSTEGKTFSLPYLVLYYSEDVIYFEGDFNRLIREDSDLYTTVFGESEEE